MDIERSLNIFLCGDVMTGRGVDQVLPRPGDPVLHESYVRDAREYVRLAEQRNGPIPRPVGYEYIWGHALEELEKAGVDFRIINLETSITRSDRFWQGKEVHYRMHPRNVGCLTAARIHCCGLANNHVLDWGEEGLLGTLDVLDAAGLPRAGAGRSAEEAASPVVLDAGEKGRVLVASVGSTTSGIPPYWGATPDRPGVNLLEDLSVGSARGLAAHLARFKRPGDVAVVSIHWGSNWGYRVPARQIEFAHALVDQGVDIVHGHSSHHPRPLELYRNRLILYGCGDFINDYEGIGGYEEFRGDLAVMYLVRIGPGGEPLEVRLVPMRMRRFRLHRAPGPDARWLHEVLNRESRPFTTRLHLHDDDSLTVHPG